MNSPEELTTYLKRRAHELGFALSGACPAVTPPRWHKYLEWLNQGYAGEMTYLSERREAYAHPDAVLSGVRSLLMLGMHYATVKPAQPEVGHGRISRYAWGDVDYHDLIQGRLKQLCAELREQIPGIGVRGIVDTAPLLEREFAELAGLGWVGKHTLLLTRDAGSWFFLAVLLIDQELQYDVPSMQNYCGSCTACLDACPTDAFPEPYLLDARRCISYLTIELREPIPVELRPGIGDWVFGCDICQEVCPWNRRAPVSQESAFAPADGHHTLNLMGLFCWSEEQFRHHFRQTPIWRAKRRGLLRNAAIVLGNQGSRDAISALKMGLDDSEPLVRGASAWALGQIGTPLARELLTCRVAREDVDQVCQELRDALEVIAGRTS